MCLPGSGNSVAGEPGDWEKYLRELDYHNDRQRKDCDFCGESRPEYQVEYVPTDGTLICEDCRRKMTIGQLIKYVKKTSHGDASQDAEYVTDLINDIWPQHRPTSVQNLCKKNP